MQNNLVNYTVMATTKPPVRGIPAMGNFYEDSFELCK